MRSSLALALVLAAAAPGDCGGRADPVSTATDPATTVSQTTPTRLFGQQHTGWRGPEETVLRERGAWEAAWRTLHDGTPEQPAPTVDFARHMVVLVALGEMNTGGHSVEIKEFVPEGTGALVRYTVTQPGPNCMTTQAVTSPAEVASVPRVTGTVRFERRVVREQC